MIQEVPALDPIKDKEEYEEAKRQTEERLSSPVGWRFCTEEEIEELKRQGRL